MHVVPAKRQMSETIDVTLPVTSSRLCLKLPELYMPHKSRDVLNARSVTDSSPGKSNWCEKICIVRALAAAYLIITIVERFSTGADSGALSFLI